MSNSSSSHPRQPPTPDYEHHPSQPQRVSASSATRRPDDDPDISWLDFLRTAGGTVPDQSDNTDRKRRHPGADPERRRYPQPPYNTFGPAARPTFNTPFHAGSTMANPIDVDSNGPPVIPRRTSGPNGSARASVSRRSGSEAGPPKWQPDDEVNQCPVCKSDFSFFFRKHHCRKCGRVVCSGCSPHRITIPRQYVVQPERSQFEIEFLPDEPTSPTTFNPALGGGEVVRVCKPCVPDPWTPDSSIGGTESATARAERSMDEYMRRHAPRRGERMSESDAVPHLSSRQRSERYRYMPPPAQVPGNGGHSRSNSHQPSAYHFSRSVPHQSLTGHAFGALYRPSVPPSSSRPAGFGHRHTQSSNNPLPPIPSGLRHHPQGIAIGAPQLPRRKIAEEDECPVCGCEMPAGEQVREAHIQECINSRFITGTPSSSTPPVNAPPNPDAAQPPHPGTSVSPPTTRPRASSYKPRGMITYKATEKDCTNASGETQECVICFEDFAPGDDMGRMECLCKFHRHCIRAWWMTKGTGVCPTHALTD